MKKKRKKQCKISLETKKLMEKHSNTKVQSQRGTTEVQELKKINK